MGNRLVYGVQGGRGSFNDQLIQVYLEQRAVDADVEYLFTTKNVLQALEKGTIDWGLFAVTNSLAGIVQESQLAMQGRRFVVLEELELTICHHLMKRPDIAMSVIETIMAHPQVLRQCERTLAERYAQLTLRSGTGNLLDTARAAQALSEGKLPMTTAILGCEAMAEWYGLEIVDRHLEDREDNVTTFWLVQREFEV